MELLSTRDPRIANLIAQEEAAQTNQLNFIASENYAYPTVREILGSVLTNIYAEGYPGKRYYAGCQQVDALETIAIDRCKELFNAEHANVQPHSGSQANMAVLFGALQPGDTLMGLSLTSGGHLTHGHPVNFSGKLYKSVTYTVHQETEYLDYDYIEQLAHQYKPKIIITGGSSYSRTISHEKLHSIAQSVNAFLLVDIAHTAGLIATGHYPNPSPYADFITGTTQKTLRGPRGGFILCKKDYKDLIDKAVFPGIQGGPAMNVIAAKAVTFHYAAQKEFADYTKQALATAQTMCNALQSLGYRIVSGGTDTHLFVIDLRNKNLTGRTAEQLLEKVGILTSRSAIPFDTQKPFITSGIRLGTLAFTARGYTQQDALKVVDLIDELLSNPDNDTIKQTIAKQVTKLATRTTVNDS